MRDMQEDSPHELIHRGMKNYACIWKELLRNHEYYTVRGLDFICGTAEEVATAQEISLWNQQAMMGYFDGIKFSFIHAHPSAVLLVGRTQPEALRKKFGVLVGRTLNTGINPITRDPLPMDKGLTLTAAQNLKHFAKYGRVPPTHPPTTEIRVEPSTLYNLKDLCAWGVIHAPTEDIRSTARKTEKVLAKAIRRENRHR